MAVLRTAAATAGLAVIAYLVQDAGIAALSEALATVGWGIIAIAAFELVPLAVKAQAWRTVLNAESELSYRDVLAARWIRQSVSQLLPVAQVGGDMVGARVVYLRGAGDTVAGACTLVDMTLGAAAQVLCTIAALVLLLADGEGALLAQPALIGSLVFAAGLAVFVWQQQRAPFAMISRKLSSTRSRFAAVLANAQGLDEALGRVYCRRGTVFRSLLWQLGAQILAVGEIVIFGLFLGVDISLVDAFVLQSVSRGFRLAVFFVPGGYGVQEGSLVMLAVALGFDPDFGLIVALLKRAREVIVGAPAVLVWYRYENARAAGSVSGG